MKTIFAQFPEYKEPYLIYCLLTDTPLRKPPHSNERYDWLNWQEAEYEAYKESKKLSQEAPEGMNHPFFVEFVKARYREVWEAALPA